MNFPPYSLYELEKMDDQFLADFCQVAKGMFEDIILIQDLCQSIVNSCTPNCKHHLAKDELDLNYNGVSTLFKLVGVKNLNHQEQLEDLAYHIIETTRALNYTLEERAKFICDAWKEKVFLWI